MTVEHEKLLLISDTRSSHRLRAYALSLSLFQISHDLIIEPEKQTLKESVEEAT
jgi:hypothetical protein